MQHTGGTKRARYVDNSCTFRPVISKTTEQLAINKRMRMMSVENGENEGDRTNLLSNVSVDPSRRLDIVSILLHPINSDTQWKERAKQVLD